MEVRVTAPNRIDLAGGTTDLYPLFLFMDGGGTVNAAISVFSTVSLRTVHPHHVRIVSEDLNEWVEASHPQGLPIEGPLGMIGRAVRAVSPSTGLEIVTRNDAPPGSGLGASSALLVALLTGLFAVKGQQLQPRELVDYAVHVETAALGVPAGSQDHIAATYGGLTVMDFGYRGFDRKPCSNDPQLVLRLEDSLILSYTGQGRFSGMNNWEVFRGYIDKEPGIPEKLADIRNVARRLAEALQSGRFEQVPLLIDREWRIRRSLAPGISSPTTEAIMTAARSAGASASKVCGAGGGGCMITVAEPDRRAAVESAMVDAGATLMPFHIVPHGVKVEVSS
jgi:D-glycero-alpha-D-manno-heptose-7-phosphate kinase